jgi:hypothetical protein
MVDAGPADPCVLCVAVHRFVLANDVLDGLAAAGEAGPGLGLYAAAAAAAGVAVCNLNERCGCIAAAWDCVGHRRFLYHDK